MNLLAIQDQIQILLSDRCLNQQEICRMLNGWAQVDVNRCSLTFKEKPWGQHYVGPRCPQCHNGCSVSYAQTRRALQAMLGVYSIKRRWWDNNKSGKKTDIFRFHWKNWQAYADRVLSHPVPNESPPAGKESPACGDRAKARRNERMSRNDDKKVLNPKAAGFLEQRTEERAEDLKRKMEGLVRIANKHGFVMQTFISPTHQILTRRPAGRFVTRNNETLELTLEEA